MLSTLRSFRTRHVNEAVGFGETNSLLQGVVQRAHGRHSIAVSLEGSEKQVVLDHKKADPIHYLGFFDVFLFSYPLLEVIRGGPEERRKFLDRAIAISRPGYLSLLIQYHRALKQKNALLLQLQREEMNKKEGLDQMGSFNEQMVEHGLSIVIERNRYLGSLQGLLRKKQQLFFPGDSILGIELNSSFAGTAEEVQKLLNRNLDREIFRGTALAGIHRDEIQMTIDGKELRKYGSSGQHRAYLLLMLLAQLELYETLRGDRPVLLLDDLDSELDERKIQSFLTEISGRYQTLISTSRRQLFAGQNVARLFQIDSGELMEM